ncbi:CipC1 protein [Penicillium maclennaniae]|uniref:CipC1 protein n=1 Tax=Penicillium maclennaniae TaxID=1343394 RepID=UPI0025414529|nr:CipC1 protein [Penicillium maclennaniae]KAJ5674543.1 CipC1 protein [Penicillium maclennaniae]
MGFFSDDSDQANYADQWNASNPQEHDPSFAHELIAGAASFEAAKAYENHVAENGQPPNHQMAKELLAGFAGAFIDREVETKGLDFIDREKAKRQAEEHFNNVDPSQYGY